MKENILKKLYDRIEKRKVDRLEGSYTAYLFNNGLDKILKKIGEENTEVIIEACKDSNEDLKEELVDLMYHTMVLMVEKNIKLEDIQNIMEARYMIVNNKKEERKSIEKW